MVDPIPDDINFCPASALPKELIHRILNKLDGVDAINSALVCQRWKALAKPLLENIRELNILLNKSCCNKSRLNGLEYLTEICACGAHVSEQCVMLCQLLSLQNFQNIRRINVEDDVPVPKEKGIKSTVNTIVRHLNKDLETMQFTNVDMSLFDILSFASLGQFRNITTLVLVDCSFPLGVVSNSLFVKALAPVLPTLEHLELTGTPFVTDEFGVSLAKYGVSLAHVNLQRCSNITAITVTSFCTHAGSETRQKPVTFDLYSTRFDANALDCYLHRLQMFDEKSWTLNLFDMRETNGRMTVTISNQNENGYTVFY
uniref:F-box domain-containing protein n=1 Tax=Panagrolaimus sp. JU765 TaxID=591449 RepID=A0AC34QSF6_9BILA